MLFTLYSARINYRSIKQSTGIQNLDSDQYFDERIALPPLKVQAQVVSYLDTLVARIDRVVEKCNLSIELLKERRSALITAAVTGQIYLGGTA